MRDERRDGRDGGSKTRARCHPILVRDALPPAGGSHPNRTSSRLTPKNGGDDGRLGQDIRYAVRAAVRTPSVSILAILAFALGIGVTTAVFSIFNGVLLAPLPFPNPDELVAVYGTQPACATCPASFPKYYDWKTRNKVFAAMGGSTQASFVLTGHGRGRAGQRRCPPPRRSTTSSACSRSSGRWYTEEEDQLGGPQGRGARATSSGSAASAATVRRRPHADLRRRALRSDRRHAGDLHASQRRLLRPAAAQARSGDARQPLPRHLRAARSPACRSIAPSGEMRALGESLAREYGYNHGIDVRSYREVVVGQIRGAAAGAARRGLLRAADRLRQRREPAAGVGPGAPARDRRPARARRRAAATSRAS